VVLADAGLPMITFEFPAMVTMLVPVIVVEALVLRRQLSLGTARSVTLSATANIASTLIGIPLSWCAMLVIELVTAPIIALGAGSPVQMFARAVLQAAWLPPSDEAQLLWLAPVAAMVLLVPAFFVSVVLERRMLTKSCPEISPTDLSRACWRANEVSYALLCICLAGYFLWALKHGHPSS
jgi:hypothetical protein